MKSKQIFINNQKTRENYQIKIFIQIHYQKLDNIKFKEENIYLYQCLVKK